MQTGHRFGLLAECLWVAVMVGSLEPPRAALRDLHLFSDTGKIIGQLYAGQSNCIGTQNNNDYDIYGRFGISWDAGQNPSSRLKDWLDPLGTGQATTASVQNVLRGAR